MLCCQVSLCDRCCFGKPQTKEHLRHCFVVPCICSAKLRGCTMQIQACTALLVVDMVLLAYLCVGHLRHLLEVVLRACADATDHDLFRCTPTQRSTHAVQQLLLRQQQVLIG